MGVRWQAAAFPQSLGPYLKAQTSRAIINHSTKYGPVRREFLVMKREAVVLCLGECNP